MRKFLFVVAAVMLNDRGEILLTERPSGKSLAGLWEFPGGKVEAGEKPALALVRELKEEIHIDADAADCVPLTFVEFDYPDSTLFMPLYRVMKWRGDVVPQEGQHYAWVPLDKLSEYPVPPADEEVIRLLPGMLK